MLEEVSEGVSKHLRDSGGVPLARQAGWLREAEANTRQRFLQDDHATLAPELQRQAVDEGFARLALGYATGRVLESQAPSGLRSFLTAFKHVYYETLRLGRDINTWRERGTMDPELEAALKLATGHGEEGDALGMRRKGEVLPTGPDRIELGPSFSISRDEALAIRREIEAQKPVKVSTASLPDISTIAKVKQWSRDAGILGTTSHPQIGGEIQIAPSSIKSELGHRMSSKKAATLAVMKELIPAATYVESNRRRPDVLSHRLAGRVEVDGHPFVARIVIDEDYNGNRLYNHELSDLKELRETKDPQPLQSALSQNGQGNSWQEFGDTAKLLQWIFSVKPESGESGTGESSGNTTFSIGRSEGRLTLPEVIIGHPLAAATSHADYAAAKGGDTLAALRVADHLVDPAMIAKVRELIGERKPTLVPVVAEESAGRNKIPAGVAVKLSDALDLPETAKIKQAVRAHRSDANGLDRVFAPVSFAGEVVPGMEYLLIDDALTQGGTFAGLADYIISSGGKVIGEIALTGKNYSSTLALTDETLQRVRARLGDLEPAFRQATGHGYEALTESEARTFASWKPLDAVRARIFRERDARIHGRDEANPGGKESQAGESGLNEGDGGEAPSDTTFSIGSDSGKGFSPDANASNYSRNSNERRNETEASGELSDESEGHRLSGERTGESKGGLGGEVAGGEGENKAGVLGDGGESFVFPYHGNRVIKRVKTEGIFIHGPDGEIVRSSLFSDLEIKVDVIHALGGMATQPIQEQPGMVLVQERGEPITAAEYLSLELPFGIEPAPMRVYRVKIGGIPYFVSDLRQENFVKDRSGNVRVIDLIAGRASP